MPEYIEREAAFSDEMCEGISCQECPFLIHPVNGGCKVVKYINSIPAADVVEVRHGKWVLFDNAFSSWNVWVCSECGYRRKEGWMHTEAGKKPNAQYCEHCMAKMDGGVNDAAD